MNLGAYIFKFTKKFLLTALFVGFLLGYILSMPPMGPTNFAVMSKGFRKQIGEGLAIGAGAGFMDMIYVMISYGGVALVVTVLPASIITFFEEHELAVKLIGALLGSLVVIVYGISIINKKIQIDNSSHTLSEEIFEDDIKHSEEILHDREEKFKKLFHVSREKERNGFFIKNFFTGVLFCLSSITLPASWIAIVGYLKSYRILDSNFFTGFVFGLSVMIGTVAWFYTLLKILERYTHKLKSTTLITINKTVGILLILLGVYLIVNVLYFAMS